jgi:RimJ/RimL family protein N-acetyltransferase
MTMLALSTQRLQLDQLTYADADFIHALVNDPDWIHYIGDRGIRTRADAERYIELGPKRMYAQHGLGLLAMRLQGVPIGLCGLLRRDWLRDPELGFALLPSYRQQGLVYEAASAVLQAAAAEGMKAVLAVVVSENARSRNLLTQLGFEFSEMVNEPVSGDLLLCYRRSL